MQNFSLFDKVLTHIDRTISKVVNKSSNNQKVNQEPTPSLKLMRINHCGEICAQALYHGQALVARDKDLENKLLEAATEEQQHLEWCKKRIEELGGTPSRLNPLFGLGSFVIGLAAGLISDKVSLGFIAETENQVTEHLEKHLKLLPKEDDKSRAILLKMKEDEQQHAHHAESLGGTPMPFLVRKLMTLSAKIMTTTTGNI